MSAIVEEFVEFVEVVEVEVEVKVQVVEVDGGGEEEVVEMKLQVEMIPSELPPITAIHLLNISSCILRRINIRPYLKKKLQ